MHPDIHQVLAYEIKKEIADRYFGFRKLIEEDKLDFAERARQYSFILEKRISFDLIRIYILLGTAPLIERFFALTGLPADLFYDPYLIESPTIRERVFSGLRLHGLTNAGRFKNLILDCYERIEEHLLRYREKYEELKKYREEINQEIEVFERKNDLGSIIGFLKTLGDHNQVGGMAGGLELGMAQDMEKKMRIEPQLAVEHYLPMIPPLPPLSAIRTELKQLARDACDDHGQDFIRLFSEILRGKGQR